MLSEARKSWRANKVGASEVPALFLPPGEWYYTAADLYYRKIGEVADEIPEGPKCPATVGSYLETAIVDWAKDELGVTEGRRNVPRAHDNGVLGATLDFQVQNSERTGRSVFGVPLEIKTTGLFGRTRSFEEWGGDGTDEVPTPIMLQVQAQMACTGADQAFIAALIGGRGFALFHVVRNGQLCALIADRAEAFWRRNVERRRCPDNPSLETLSQIYREAGDTAVIARDLIDEYQELGRQIGTLDARRKEVKREILESMAVDGVPCEAAASTDDWWRLTFKETFRKAYTVEASSYRTLRVRAGAAQKQAQKEDSHV